MKRASGFTMVELVFTMMIVGILTAMAIPSFKYVTSSNRVSTEINSLLGDMQYARAEAIKEGFWVTVCATTDGTSCSNSTTWTTGWIVFSDPNNNRTVVNSQILKVTKPGTSGTDTLVTDNTMGSVTFNREGFSTLYTTTGTSIAATVTMKLNTAPQNTQWERCLAITAVGGTTATQKYGGNCT